MTRYGRRRTTQRRGLSVKAQDIHRHQAEVARERFEVLCYQLEHTRKWDTKMPLFVDVLFRTRDTWHEHVQGAMI